MSDQPLFVRPEQFLELNRIGGLNPDSPARLQQEREILYSQIEASVVDDLIAKHQSVDLVVVDSPLPGKGL